MKEAKLPERNCVEVFLYGSDQEDYHCGFSARYFLAPPPAESPSAYFAVNVPENPLDTPNMMYEDIVVTSSTGVTLAFKEENKTNCAKMAAAATREDAVVRFKMRVLVNQAVLQRGDLLTRPERTYEGCAVREPKAPARITPGDVVKRQRCR